MNFADEREPVQGGFRPRKNYDVALKMLKCHKKDEFRIFSPAEEPQPVFACHFCNVPSYEHLLALANEEGKIAIQDTKASQDHIISTQGHMNAIFEVAWSPVALRLVSVSGDQSAALWAVAGDRIAPLASCQGHSRSVKVVAYRPQNADVFATGGRDGVIIVWDCRCPPTQHQAVTVKPDNVIPCAHVRTNCGVGGGSSASKSRALLSRAESITGLVFQDDYTLISCAAGDGVINVWDARKFYAASRRAPMPCHRLPYAGQAGCSGFTSLSLCPVSRHRLYANCVDSNVYCYNVAAYTPEPVAVYTGHHNQTYYVKSCVSGDGAYLVSGSSDESAYVWSVARPPHPIARLNGHAAEVTCVDWAANVDGDIKVATCGDDSSHRLWRLHPPTDTDRTDELAGWAEWLDDPPAVRTPRARRIRPQSAVRGDLESAKRAKVEESPQSSSAERSLQSLENKGPRQLFTEAVALGAAQELMSPTSNLPNYVVEGTSPHHQCTRTPSSATKHKENWLSKLQSTPSPSQTQPQRTMPKRRASQSKACGNLLRFFKVEVKKTSVEEGDSASGQTPAPTASVTTR